MDVRNLGLFFPDDRSAIDANPELIDQVNRTPFGWDEHCRDAAERKELKFELMSADINFVLDASDPGSHAGVDKNSWGLVHALAGLARRQELDRCGNRLPLAWEVRTISPEIFSTDPNATRIYGLLRALAAQPREGESLEDCIRREYQEETLAAGKRETISDEALLLEDVMIEDLARRKVQPSEAMSAVSRLLPKWRSMFLRAVKNNEVSIHIERAVKVKKLLMKANKPVPLGTKGLIVPIMNRDTSRFVYGLNLFSIMADVLDGEALDPARKDSAITTMGGSSTNVVEWYEALMDAAVGDLRVNLPERLYALAKKAEDHIKAKNVGDFLKSLNGQSIDPGLLLLVLAAHARLRGIQLKAGKVIQQLSVDYDFTVSENTFTRAFRNNPLVLPKGTPRTAVANLLKALQDDPTHNLGDRWVWIKEGLRRWYDEALAPKNRGDQQPIRPEIARHNAPGLFVP